MNTKKILPVSLIVLGIVLILFTSGSSILTRDIFNVPAGNVILWVGFIALQIAAYTINNGFQQRKTLLTKVLRLLMILLVVVSMLWFGIAYILSGNVNFNFSSSATSFLGSPRASLVHWGLIYTLIAGPIILTLVNVIFRLVQGRSDIQ